MFKKNLVPLALGGFGIGMTEFVMMGILPDIAKDLGITIPQAGYLISAYALGVVFGAPTLVGIFSSRAPKTVLIGFMTLFTVFNALSAFSPNFTILMICRFLAGLPHGAFFGVGAIVAVRLADEGKAASAMATMFAGLTLANVIGVPIGIYAGHNASWRIAFAMVAGIGVLTIFTLKIWVPYVEPNPKANLLRDLSIFRSRNLWLALAITSIGTGGFFAWFSYIAPLLTDVSLFSSQAIPWIMTVVGVGMTVGVVAGGRLADRFEPIKAIVILLVCMVIVLGMNGVLAESQPMIVLLAFITGANALALGPPLQVLLIRNSRKAEMLGSSLGQSGFNIGNAMGAFLGGIPLTLGYSYRSPQWIAAVLALGGLMLAMLMLRIRDRADNSVYPIESAI